MRAFKPLHPIFWRGWHTARLVREASAMFSKMWNEEIAALRDMYLAARSGPNDPYRVNTLSFIHRALRQIVIDGGAVEAFALHEEVEALINKIVARLVRDEAEGRIKINLVRDPLGLERQTAS
jgi:hypothetical protein